MSQETYDVDLRMSRYTAQTILKELSHEIYEGADSLYFDDTSSAIIEKIGAAVEAEDKHRGDNDRIIEFSLTLNNIEIEHLQSIITKAMSERMSANYGAERGIELFLVWLDVAEQQRRQDDTIDDDSYLDMVDARRLTVNDSDSSSLPHEQTDLERYKGEVIGYDVVGGTGFEVYETTSGHQFYKCLGECENVFATIGDEHDCSIYMNE